MKDSVYHDFNEAWTEFESHVKAGLRKHTKSGYIEPSLVNLILSEASTAWEARYDFCGRWLKEYSQHHPLKGEQLRVLLTNNTTFTPIPRVSCTMWFTDVVVLTLGASTGYAIAYWLTKQAFLVAYAPWHQWIQIGLTVLPMMASIPILRRVKKMSEENASTKVVEAYMEQLEKIRQSAVAMLK